MNDRAPSLEMAPGKASNVDYKQKFVQAPMPNPGPCNHKAMKAPSMQEMMATMTK